MELGDFTTVGDLVRGFGAWDGGGGKEEVSSIICSNTDSTLAESLVSWSEIGEVVSTFAVAGFLIPLRNGFLAAFTSAEGGGNNWN